MPVAVGEPMGSVPCGEAFRVQIGRVWLDRAEHESDAGLRESEMLDEPVPRYAAVRIRRGDPDALRAGGSLDEGMLHGQAPRRTGAPGLGMDCADLGPPGSDASRPIGAAIEQQGHPDADGGRLLGQNPGGPQDRLEARRQQVLLVLGRDHDDDLRDDRTR
ncbi:hypothetical protein GCM10012320_09650 [Sinomonas cellulolyticus]|nr:hypothetical protein GCM10012320_09650 [Sinomonas sp. KCTC 49339]